MDTGDPQDLAIDDNNQHGAADSLDTSPQYTPTHQHHPTTLSHLPLDDSAHDQVCSPPPGSATVPLTPPGVKSLIGSVGVSFPLTSLHQPHKRGPGRPRKDGQSPIPRKTKM